MPAAPLLITKHPTKSSPGLCRSLLRWLNPSLVSFWQEKKPMWRIFGLAFSVPFMWYFLLFGLWGICEGYHSFGETSRIGSTNCFLGDPRFDEKQPPGVILPSQDECIYLDPKRVSHFRSARSVFFGGSSGLKFRLLEDSGIYIIHIGTSIHVFRLKSTNIMSSNR